MNNLVNTLNELTNDYLLYAGNVFQVKAVQANRRTPTYFTKSAHSRGAGLVHTANVYVYTNSCTWATFEWSDSKEVKFTFFEWDKKH